MKVLDPTAAARRASDAGLPALKTLTGTTVATMSNGWPSLEAMIGHFRKWLPARHGVSRVEYYDIPRNCAADEELLARAARTCDAAIVGLGN